MYKTITDPYTQKNYSINSEKGIGILKNYITFSVSKIKNHPMKGGSNELPSAGKETMEL